MLKRISLFLLVLAMVVSLGAIGLAAGGEVLTGKAKGFMGVIEVSVTKDGDDITAIEVKEEETPDIGGAAIKELVDAIIEKDSTEVDTVASATVSSKALIAAVNNALDPAAYPFEEEKKEDEEVVAVADSELTLGTAVLSNGREMRSPDSEGTPVYTLNIVYASALFNKDGQIVDVIMDTMEVATPNYDGEGMPHFGGWPGQGGYNYDEKHDGTITGKFGDSEDDYKASFETWLSKRGRGDSYRMTTDTWAAEMDAYQKFFVGKTVEEIEAWVAKNTSDANGRPLTEASDKEGDAEKYAALSDEEKAALQDLTASATMSLTDNHGNLVATLKKAYEARRPVAFEAAKQYGLGVRVDGRVGPGKDAADVQVYSFNVTVATVLLDAEDKIADVLVDILEVASPNYDGDGMPHFSGWPGQGGYNYDEKHDGDVSKKTEDTLEWFLGEVEAWQTKRDRGDAYRMTTATWSEEMDAYQTLFIGKTIDEVREWVKKFTSDVNGRPLTDASDKDGDVDKYKALSDEDKAALLDVTSSATMSLTDAHGNIIEAIANAIENVRDVDITVTK